MFNYLSLFERKHKKMPNELWVVGDSIMTIEFSGGMVHEIAKAIGCSLYRETFSGSTIAPALGVGMIDRIEQHVFQHHFAKYGEPKIIVLQRGTNDVYWNGIIGNALKLGDPASDDLRTTYGAIKFACSYFKTLCPNARIIWSTAFYNFQASHEKLLEFNSNLTKICQGFGIEVFDLYTATGLNEENCMEYLIEGIHPNKRGRALLKKLWIDYLKTDPKAINATTEK